MRWPAFFLLSSACLAGYSGPLPEIKAGTRQRELVIAETTWHAGQFSTSQAFLVGTVTAVAADVQTKPQQVWLSESCTVRVEAAFGHLPQIAGVGMVKLQSGTEHSPYVPVPEDWGRLRHLQQGQKILVLLHEYEDEPCFGSAALVMLNDSTSALADLLRRTGFDAIQFTDEELLALRAAAPLLHEQILAESATERAMYAQESRQRRQSLVELASMAGVIVLGVVLICRWWRRWSAQNPIT